jgi:spermidine synthase
LQILYQTASCGQDLMVCDTHDLYGEKGSFRVLQFANEAIQGAMDLRDPKRILFEYPRAIIHLMEHNHPDLSDAFIIGHGIGTLPGYWAHRRVKVAEWDGTILELSRKYFGYTGDNVTVGDGRAVLEAQGSHTYDCIVLDAFTEKGTPRHLISGEFFAIAREKLDSQGSIIMNLIGKGDHDPLISAVHSTLVEQFAYTRSFCLSSKGTIGMRNILIMGSPKPIGFQARQMAGFTEIHLAPGFIITDGK